jgi:MoxR-like ATPase
MDGRSFVLPEDVKAMAAEVLRHRVVLSYEAEAEGIGADAVIARVLGALTLP